MPLKRRVAVNIASNWVGFFVQAVAGIIVIPFILRQVGKEAYGVWAILAGMLAYFQILQDAFSLSMNRFAAYYRSDIESVSRYFTATVYIMLLLGTTVIMLGFGASFIVCRVFPIPETLEWQAQVTCVLVGVQLAIVAVNSSMIGLLNGFQLYAASNLTKITQSVIRVGLVFLILGRSPNIVVLGLCYCASAFVSLIVTVVSVLTLISGIRCFTSANRKVYLEIYKYTKHSLIRSGSDLFMYATLLPLVGFFGTMRDVAMFSLASRIPQIVRGVLGSAQSVFLPAFSTLFAKEGPSGIIRIIRASTRFNALLTFTVITLFVAYTDSILKFWLKAEYDPRIVLPMILLLLSVVPRGVFEIWMPGLVAMGVLKWLSIMAMITCVSTITITAFLANIVDPAIAPAIALLIGLGFRSGFWLPIYGVRITGIEMLSYLRATLLRPILATVIVTVILMVAFRIVPVPSDPWLFLIHGAATATLVVSIAVIVVLPGEIKRFAKSLFLSDQQ